MFLIYFLSVSAVLHCVESVLTGEQSAVEYFSEGFIRVFACSLNKKPDELEQLLKPAMNIARRMDESGKLSFLGQFGRTWFLLFFERLHYSSYNDTITYMRELKSFMENRRELCSAELNEIIDATNVIICEDHGRNIFALIDEYQRFPNVNKTGEQLCQELIEAFLKPFLMRKILKVTNLVKHVVQRIDELNEGVQCDASFNNTIRTMGNISNETPVEGYLIQAYLRFLEIILQKEDNLLTKVLKNAGLIVAKKQFNGDYSWLSTFRYSLPRIISYYFTYTRTAVIKAQIPERFYNKMKNRETAFDKDINELIDFGNKFITEEQKDELFEVLDDFDKFPDSKRNAEELCKDLIDEFSRPFKENKHHQNLEMFISKLKTVLRRQYPDKKYAFLFSDATPGVNEIDQLVL